MADLTALLAEDWERLEYDDEWNPILRAGAELIEFSFNEFTSSTHDYLALRALRAMYMAAIPHT